MARIPKPCRECGVFVGFIHAEENGESSEQPPTRFQEAILLPSGQCQACDDVSGDEEGLQQVASVVHRTLFGCRITGDV